MVIKKETENPALWYTKWLRSTKFMLYDRRNYA